MRADVSQSEACLKFSQAVDFLCSLHYVYFSVTVAALYLAKSKVLIPFFNSLLSGRYPVDAQNLDNLT